jgi:ABC-type nickel/cobalt efflux system permease component RcnA
MRITSHRARRLGIFSFVFLVLGSGSVFAHPMGNFSVNHYGKIRVGQKSVEILYLVDMAEIPTYQEMRQFGITTTPDEPDVNYLNGQATQLKEGLILEVDGKAVDLATISRDVTFADGAGGLPTMKLRLIFRGMLDVPAGVHRLSYTDNNFPGRSGWKEVVVVSDGATIVQSSASELDRSKELTNYSTDLLNSPPQQLAAVVDFRTTIALPVEHSVQAGSGTAVRHAIAALPSVRHSAADGQDAAVSPKKSAPSSFSSVASSAAASSSAASVRSESHPANTPRSRFTELISSQGKLNFWFLLSAACIAAGLGALHALEPGHGKTIVAAYLAGSRGTARHAVLLGFVVTAAHTAGVYLLGVVTLYASRYIVPEQLYPWLGAISGLSVSGLGIFMLVRHLTGETGDHTHARGERHSHGFLSMLKLSTSQPASNNDSDSTPGSSKPAERALSLRELCLLGITGGIVPCPAALVVLLSAFSLHRIGFGLFLITAFSLGLAAVLVVVGLTMVYTKRFVAAHVQTGGSPRSPLQFLPLLSSAFMVLIGLGIAVSAFASVPIGPSLLSRDRLVPFATVIVLGLFLGMRHSTDPDHVVAVSTIVSRQRSMKSSATIGLLWGLGHTITIFLVGAAIIIFGVVIPPRLGLSMEFCVALMLILLGILNLTGVTTWLTERSTPKIPVSGVTDQGAAADSTMTGFDKSKPSLVRQARLFLERTIGSLGLYQTVRPLAIGLVHGLAGSAAVALLVLSTIKSPFWATAYLLVFGFGTMLGMMFMTTAMCLPLVYSSKRFFRLNGHLATISGLASMAFGMFLVYHIGLVDGLFTAQPHWIPQ